MASGVSIPQAEHPKISLCGVEKIFGSKPVLCGVDLEVMPGESVAVIGASGSGKSVMMKCIAGLLAPDAGDIRIGGKTVLGLSRDDRHAVNRRFGMLFQNAALLDSMPIWRNVAFGLIEGRGMDRREAREIALAKLEMVGIGRRDADLMPSEISGGMRKRAGLARAIALDPEIIFFDEPTTGIDPVMGDIIDALIVDCTQRLSATALSITHDIRSARRIADKIAMLHEGKIIWSGPPSALDAPGDARVEQFVHGRIEGPITAQTGTAQTGTAQVGTA